MTATLQTRPRSALPTPTRPAPPASDPVEQSRVVAVVDPTAVTGRLLPARFTDLGPGRVGVLAPPGMRRDSWLAADILAALGCRSDVKGARRPGEGDWEHVVVWLTTHQVRHLYIRHAWTLPLRILDVLLELLERTSVTLWLAGDTLFTDAHADTLRPWTADTMTGEDFLSRWEHLTSAPVPATSPDSRASSWPDRLPDDDFTTFRAACRNLLDPVAFEIVDARFRAGVAAATAQPPS